MEFQTEPFFLQLLTQLSHRPRFCPRQMSQKFNRNCMPSCQTLYDILQIFSLLRIDLSVAPLKPNFLIDFFTLFLAEEPDPVRFKFITERCQPGRQDNCSRNAL